MKQNYLKHLFTALLLMCTAVATAHDFEVGGIYYNILSENEKTVEVTYQGGTYLDSENEYRGDIIIPKEVSGYRVVAIGTQAFAACNKITSVTIPSTIKSIGDFAFGGYKIMDAVYITDLVAWLEIEFSTSSSNPLCRAEKLYLNGELITDLVIPIGVQEIKTFAFFGAECIKSVTIPNSVTNVGENAFYGCTGLSAVYINKLSAWCKIDFINDFSNPLFYAENLYINGELLTEIIIPDNVEEIKNYAFFNCASLESITIPSTIISISDRALNGCSRLTSINVVEGNSVYDSREGCNAIIETATNTLVTGCKKTIIPNGVTSIGNYAFYNSNNLTKIEIPSSITKIGDNAFFGCSNLRAVYNNSPLNITAGSSSNGYVAYYASTIIQETDEVQGDYVFRIINGSPTLIAYIGNNTEITLPENYKEESYLIGEKAFRNSPITSIVIPNCVTSIGNSAFYGCSSLTCIEIPNSITSIGDGAFYNCSNLRVVYNNSPLNITAGSASYGYVSYYANVVILSSDDVQGDYVFRIINGLPTLIAYIGNNAEITLPENYKDEKYAIGEKVFRNNSITSIMISNSVISIGNSAFYGCSALTSVTIGNSVATIGNSAFYGCSALTSLTIPNSITSILNYAFNGCKALKELRIEDGFNNLSLGYNFDDEDDGGKGLFYDCPLETIYLGRNLSYSKSKEYGYSPFYYIKTLISLTISNSVTSIGDNAFCYCSGLTGELTIPASVTSIGGSAFEGCVSLTSIAIPNSVTSIANWAFAGCTSLTSITSLIPADALFAVSTNVFNNVDKKTCTLYVPYGAKETYASTAGWSGFANIVEIVPADITITINEYGNATYCSPYALDFSNVEGLKAYSAIGFNSSTQVVTLARVMTTPAEAGIFVKGEPGEYVVPIIEECNEHTLNLLVGTLEQTTVNSTEGEMSNYKFTVAELDEVPMFYPFEDNTAFSAGKAYLQIPTAWLPATAQKSVSVRFDEGETTDIDEVKGESGEGKTVYDLQGRVVENPASGIYIIDGKKVIIK